MGRSIKYCFDDYLEHIDYIERPNGGWRGNKTEYGVVWGTMLLVGPLWKPDEIGDLRPMWWYHYLSGHDVKLLVEAFITDLAGDKLDNYLDTLLEVDGEGITSLDLMTEMQKILIFR